jgi:hypothetical protein
MKTVGAVFVAVAILFIGIAALSQAGAQVEQPAVDNGTNATEDAYDLTRGITENVSQPLVVLVPFMGAGAILFTWFGWTFLRGGGR